MHAVVPVRMECKILLKQRRKVTSRIDGSGPKLYLTTEFTPDPVMPEDEDEDEDEGEDEDEDADFNIGPTIQGQTPGQRRQRKARHTHVLEQIPGYHLIIVHTNGMEQSDGGGCTRLGPVFFSLIHVPCNPQAALFASGNPHTA